MASRSARCQPSSSACSAVASGLSGSSGMSPPSVGTLRAQPGPSSWKPTLKRRSAQRAPLQSALWWAAGRAHPHGKAPGRRPSSPTPARTSRRQPMHRASGTDCQARGGPHQMDVAATEPAYEVPAYEPASESACARTSPGASAPGSAGPAPLAVRSARVRAASRSAACSTARVRTGAGGAGGPLPGRRMAIYDGLSARAAPAVKQAGSATGDVAAPALALARRLLRDSYTESGKNGSYLPQPCRTPALSKTARGQTGTSVLATRVASKCKHRASYTRTSAHTATYTQHVLHSLAN